MQHRRERRGQRHHEVGGGKLTGASAAQLKKLPAAPPANFTVPVDDPNLIVVLNKQVRDATGGGLTIAGLSVTQKDDKGAGLTRDFAVAHCAPNSLPELRRSPKCRSWSRTRRPSPTPRRR